MRCVVRAQRVIVDDICSLVDTALAGEAHTRDNVKGRVLAAAFATIKITKIGVFHLVDVQGGAVVGGKNRRLSSELIINPQTLKRKKLRSRKNAQKSSLRLRRRLPK